MFGFLDPYGVLQPHEIHFKASDALKDPLEGPSPNLITGNVLVNNSVQKLCTWSESTYRSIATPLDSLLISKRYSCRPAVLCYCMDYCYRLQQLSTHGSVITQMSLFSLSLVRDPWLVFLQGEVCI